MAHEITGLTKCKLCPAGDKGGTFTGPMVTIIGNDPKIISGNKGDVKRLIDYVNQLSIHVIKKHPQENEAIQYRGLEYLAMLRLANFSTTDSALDEQIRFLRWSTLQQVLPIRLNDAKLEDMAEAFTAEIGKAFADAVLEGMTAGDAAVAFKEAHAKIRARLKEEFRRLADQYEQPGQFNLEVVEVVKP